MAKKRITKVYTKTGDMGETSLVGGKRVSKDSLRVDSYGDVDELNSVLGIVRALSKDLEIKNIISDIQNDLFIVGGELATPRDSEFEVPKIESIKVKKLEDLIDKYVEEVGELKEFILPSGNEAGSILHFARTVCRRAERKIVGLMRDEDLNPDLIIYINRLSDLLFVLARVENKRNDTNEIFVHFPK